MAQTENSVTAYDVEDWKNKGRTQMSLAERESWLNEGQLLLTDYAEGIEREWELIKFYGQLLAAHGMFFHIAVVIPVQRFSGGCFYGPFQIGRAHV